MSRPVGVPDSDIVAAVGPCFLAIEDAWEVEELYLYLLSWPHFGGRPIQ
jgi:hypothetical protein